MVNESESENLNHQGKWVAKCMCLAESASASVDGVEVMKVLVENGNGNVRVYVRAHRDCGCHSTYGSAHGNGNVPPAGLVTNMQ